MEGWFKYKSGKTHYFVQGYIVPLASLCGGRSELDEVSEPEENKCKVCMNKAKRLKVVNKIENTGE